MKALLIPLLAAAVLPLAARANEETTAPDRLTVDKALELPKETAPEYASTIGWLDGDSYLANPPEPDGEDGPRIVVVDARSGAARPLFSSEEMAAALACLPGITAEDARAWSGRSDYRFSATHDAVLLNERGDLFYYRFGAKRAVRLTADPREEAGETLSPDGTLAAFVADHDLWVAATAGGGPRALTAVGDAEHPLGRLDWVYQEEVYGRGNWQAYWWSPDSTRLAFLAFDETRVPEYTLVDHGEHHPRLETWRYPKAGDPNPRVRVGVVEAGGGPIRWLDLSAYELDEFLIVRVGWTPDSKEVVLQVQNRIQTWLDVVLADPGSGATRTLFRDTTGVWIEPTDAPFWTTDGQRFLWLSERDGFRHLYLYGRDGALIRRLTEGPFEVDAVHGIDEQSGAVFFTGDQGDPKGQRLFRVPLAGGDPGLLTPQAGTHSVSLSPTFEFFIDTFSALWDPGHVTLCDGDGALVRVLGAGSSAPLEKYGLTAPEFLTIPTRDGFEMEATLVRPPAFDPARKYPVLCYTYAGPHAPAVEDRFQRTLGFVHQVLAQHGILVFTCDNRSASGRGLESARGVYRNLGARELADLEDGVDWLIGQGYADPDRVGIWGWSYGGFMTAYALTHSKSFKLGVAVAPVTDWRLYDSIYTERYMDTPPANPAGYAAASVVAAAANLSGKLLLMHGDLDENVHLQHTLQLARALQEAGKEFELMIYPGNRHGVRAPKQRLHLFENLTRFVTANL